VIELRSKEGVSSFFVAERLRVPILSVGRAFTGMGGSFGEVWPGRGEPFRYEEER